MYTPNANETINVGNNLAQMVNGEEDFLIAATLRFHFPDACSLASEADALNIRQALSERSELACPPKACVRPLRCGQGGRHWFWLLLPEQKWLGCRAETRQLSFMPIIPADKILCSNMSENIMSFSLPTMQ
ncbi:MAG TPA: hypothetical protein DD706_05565 [Nitrospiraceae bacterium]|nr:hypothetical protein [Nitrospiraceae bacterium]